MKKRFSDEQIISILREAIPRQILLYQGATIGVAIILIVKWIKEKMGKI